MRVLLVEDTVGVPIKKVLEKLGFVVLLADDGESAWEMLNEADIELFLIDWMLPGFSGVDLVRKIRKTPRYGSTPIVMISGKAAKTDIVEAIEAGITSYIAKPFSAVQLRDKINDVVSRSDSSVKQQLQALCQHQDSLSARAEHPLVLFAESANSYADLAQPHMSSTVDYLLRFVDAISDTEASTPDDGKVGYRIEKHTNDIIEHLKRQHRRNRVKLVMASVESGGNSFLLMRLLKVNRHGEIPVVLTCESRADIPASQLPLIEELDVSICTREELDPPAIRDLMQKHVMADGASPVPESPAAARRRIQADLEAADGLPPMPAVYRKIRQLAEDPQSDIRDWARAIKNDPVLGAITLRHARSPAYGFQEEVVDIERAVILLGKDHMEQLVAADAIQRAFSRLEESTFSTEAFWLHSVAVGFAANVLALPPSESDRSGTQQQEFEALDLRPEEVDTLSRIDLPGRLKLDDPALPFVAGLMHDIGKVTMAQAYPGLFPLIVDEMKKNQWSQPMLAAEEAVSGGLNHAGVGEILARKWHLGGRLASAILNHHKPVAGDPYSFLIGIADLCAHSVHSFPEDANFPMNNSEIEAETSIEPFLPGGFAEQRHLSSVELDELQLIVGPIARRLTSRMQNSVLG